ncbi:hypothetical protein PHYPSEUDO_010179 [Phytophthora pseudosyringae]|uniref:Uncharacterized protein n=1 Tax=Phytophthora pseudosyringae TaxID=221518 RepID=A0A8T1WBA4_9STRA|nr:hypothetical protein PHYPSEUDO_010179 [Phytophthora pseudosyringae]
MDVPSWHPANQNSDAVRRLAMSGGASPPKRTEFKVVDTSTEAERQMVAKEEESVVLGGGRGLLDSSDRLYLVEQTRLEQQAQGREQRERRAALQTFRSNALKVQAPKPSVPEIPVVTPGSRKKSLLPVEKKSVVVIKARKRQATKEPTAKKTKKRQTMPECLTGSGEEGAQTSAKATQANKLSNSKKSDAISTMKSPTKSPATALLLQDYSSSSEDE